MLKIIIQRQPPEVFHKKSCSEKFCNIHKKTIVLKSLFNKVADLQPCNFTEKRFQHRCFPVHANGCFGLIFYFSNLYVFGCLLTITNKNKRSDKCFNSRGYSLFFLMCIFLNHLYQMYQMYSKCIKMTGLQDFYEASSFRDPFKKLRCF